MSPSQTAGELGLLLEAASGDFRRASDELRTFVERLPARDLTRRAWLEQIAARLQNHADALAAECRQPDRQSVGLLARLGSRRVWFVSAVALWAAQGIGQGALEHVGAEAVQRLEAHAALLESRNDEMWMASTRSGDRIEDVFEQLDVRHRQALEARYGLITGQEASADQIGQQLRVTPDAARKLVTEALNRAGELAGMTGQEMATHLQLQRGAAER